LASRKAIAELVAAWHESATMLDRPFIASRLQNAWPCLATGRASLVLELETDFPIFPSEEIGDCRFLARPEQGFFQLGLGQARSATFFGKDRLDQLSRDFSQWRHDWREYDPEGLGFSPSAFLGFSFDENQQYALCGEDWPNAELAWPEILLIRSQGKSAVIFSAHEPVGREDMERWLELLTAQRQTSKKGGTNKLTRLAATPSDSEWRERVAQAVAEIRADELEKIVLTRRISVEAMRDFLPSRSLALLAEQYPNCAIFAVRRGDRILLGASPERLVGIKNGEVRSEALAGTGRRKGQKNLLINDAKECHEHELVVRAILESLKLCCDGISFPKRPELLELRNVSHLCTPISGRLRSGFSLFDLVERLHPTPAVGGFPRDRALSRLAEFGEARIGWYSGGFGNIDFNGDGEIAVVLRCAALSGRKAELSAGAGIVAASDPEHEFAETEAKLSAMLSALEEGG
jgi:isochorismate synthase